MTIEDIGNTNVFSSNKNQPAPVQIKVLGVGGGGCNAVNYMYSQGYKDITFAIANTDRQALQGSNVPTQVLLGPKTCGGNGAGAIADKAREAAEESAEAIDALFNDSTKVDLASAYLMTLPSSKITLKPIPRSGITLLTLLCTLPQIPMLVQSKKNT